MASTTTHDRYPTRVAEPRIIDRDDPVVAASAREPGAGPLSVEQVDSFERDGFLFLEDVFSKQETDRFLAELHRLSADEDLKRQERVITERGTDEVRSIFEIHTVSDLFLEMARDARLADVTRQLHGEDVYLHQTRVNFKPGFRGKEFYWHSDFETWHSEDGMPTPRAISASIALTDNTEHNGPLMVMPGSHRRFVACVGETPEDNYRSSLQKQEAGTPDEDSLSQLAADFGIVAPKGLAGSVVFFDSNIMHGSNGNITPFARSNAFFVYNAVSNALQAPFAAAAPRPPYIAHREVDPLPRS
ncbi:ectoine hydroxylase [Nitriliruptor alkaliphilus]|uniref:ectoine hydroxylase n=1 Tax=Nitriliruptor alkaliphilus TaxID=427918 RepID=UPI000696BAC0|nr:ectoine hydroxylase [Nitriliruptor alkaliphilus]